MGVGGTGRIACPSHSVNFTCPTFAAEFFGGKTLVDELRCKGRCWAILEDMDHLEVLRETVARLRSEIAEIRTLNEQFRLQGGKGAEEEAADRRRQERLLEIQKELSQLAGLGRKVLSVEEMKEKHRARLHPDKQTS